MSSTPPPPRPAASMPIRRLSRRTRLPNGRAVIGALLVTLAGLGTYVASTSNSGAPSKRYAVIARPVSPGARITAADVAFRPMELAEDVRLRAFEDAERLVGAVALAPLSPGELMQASLIAPATVAGGSTVGAAHEFSFPVPRDRTPPGLRRGERIAVLATYGTSADAATVVTAHAATVLAYDSDSAGIGSASTARLTIALPDPAAVMQTAHASQVAELTVVRATQAETSLPERYVRPAAAASAPKVAS